MAKISAVDILKLYYCAPSEISADLTASALATLLADTTKVTEILNVHQDTWSMEEAEPSQDSYKNQLTGSVYRMGAKTMGDITISFTIGQYDYATKAALLGGSVINDTNSNPIGWKRARGIVEIKKCIIALTEDDVYLVAPYCNISAREANQDGAISINVTATILEPQTTAVHPEYWFDKAAVTPSNDSND